MAYVGYTGVANQANTSDGFANDVNAQNSPSLTNQWGYLYSNTANVSDTTSIASADISTSFTASGTNHFKNDFTVGANSGETVAINASLNSDIIPSQSMPEAHD